MPQRSRSPRDGKGRSLCLTETVLEYADASGSPSLLHLTDVIGAKVGSASTKRNGAGADVHQLDVFAYVPANGGEPGCRAGG